MAPEQREATYGLEVDVFAFGMLVRASHRIAAPFVRCL